MINTTKIKKGRQKNAWWVKKNIGTKHGKNSHDFDKISKKFWV